MYHINKIFAIALIVFLTGCSIGGEKKIKILQDMVESVDGERVHTKYSAFKFVSSLLKQAKNRLSLSEKQMLALNKCFKKYKVKFEDRFEVKVYNKDKKGNK